MEASVWFKGYSFCLTVPCSLPRWNAYWTTGFEMTSTWYWQRIRKHLDFIVTAYEDILPANRAASSWFFQYWILSSIGNVLSGLRDASEWDGVDWNSDTLF